MPERIFEDPFIVRGNRFIDLSGESRGCMTAIRPVGRCGDDVLWLCLCKLCGQEKAVLAQCFRKGMKNCGCIPNHRTHGATETAEYGIWIHIKNRCTNSKCKAYKDYGARGIRMCSRWMNSFINFLADVGKRPLSRLTLDRIDNNRGYNCGKCEDCIARGELSNCRWATWKVQQNNRRDTILLTLNGVTRPVTEWGVVVNINPRTLADRKKAGWSDEKILTTPLGSTSPKFWAWKTPETRKAETKAASRAVLAVGRAILARKLIHPTKLPCANCGNPAKQYHHFSGYDREHWLDVEPLCIPCHTLKKFKHNNGS